MTRVDPLLQPALTKVSEETGVPLSTVSRIARSLLGLADMKRVNAHRLTAPQVLEILIHLAMRENTPSAKLTAERAREAMMKALPILLAIVRGEQRELGYFVYGADIAGKGEERHFEDTFDAMEARVVEMVARDKMPTVLRMSPLFKKLIAVMEATEEIGAVVQAAARQMPTMATASATPPPETGLYRPRKAEDASGILAGPSGLEILYRGQGYGFKLTATHWRELARRAEAIADEMEGKPRPDLSAVWQLAAEAAGNA